MKLLIGGIVNIECDDEAYAYDGSSTITLPNVNTAGDCGEC